MDCEEAQDQLDFLGKGKTETALKFIENLL